MSTLNSSRFAKISRYLIFYPIEAIAAYIVYGILWVLPLRWSANSMGWLATKIGPLLKVHKVALGNLGIAFPEMPKEQRLDIAFKMWRSLGMVAGEYPHINRMQKHPEKYIEINGIENIIAARDDGKPALIFTAHLGNWEMATLAGKTIGMPIPRVYRRANNPFVELLFKVGRNKSDGTLIPKGPEGARMIIEELKKGEHIALVIDQKLNKGGVKVRLFGRTVTTAPAIASFAIKFKCPLIPAKTKRLPNGKLLITVYPPLPYEITGDKDKDILKIMQDINDMLETWIRETPDQWMWVHKRFEIKEEPECPAKESDENPGMREKNSGP